MEQTYLPAPMNRKQTLQEEKRIMQTSQILRTSRDMLAWSEECEKQCKNLSQLGGMLECARKSVILMERTAAQERMTSQTEDKVKEIEELRREGSYARNG